MKCARLPEMLEFKIEYSELSKRAITNYKTFPICGTVQKRDSLGRNYYRENQWGDSIRDSQSGKDNEGLLTREINA